MTKTLSVLVAVVLAGVGPAASPPAVGPLAARMVPGGAVQGDLDAFMGTVLAHRDENWKKLQQYILDERDEVDVRGPADVPIWGDRREYTWFIRDGFFVKSPLKVNGVTVPDGERRKYEDDFFNRVKARDRGRRPNASPARSGADSQDGSKDLQTFITQTRQPEFIDSAYFLRFKFEAGKYVLVGHDTFDGQDVLKIEYYPARLFSHEQDAESRRLAQGKSDRDKDMQATVERMLNKVALITIWVEPKAHQIVKYTFDNVNLDFLPAAWLMRVDTLKATMTMSQVFPGVWLPRDVAMAAGAMFALGAVDARFHLDYYDYREAKTNGRLQDPGEQE